MPECAFKLHGAINPSGQLIKEKIREMSNKVGFKSERTKL